MFYYFLEYHRTNSTFWLQPSAAAPLFTRLSPLILGVVENRRSGFSLPVAIGWAFAPPPQSGWTWLCFLFPLIAPDMRISRIRRSEKAHVFAHGKLAVRSVKLTRPSTS